MSTQDPRHWPDEGWPTPGQIKALAARAIDVFSRPELFEIETTHTLLRALDGIDERLVDIEEELACRDHEPLTMELPQ